jgi:glycosyltransferase involved in cell wall biosynthesis
MIIGIDGNEANVEEQVGVSVYTLSLLRHFSEVADKETQFKIFLKHRPLSVLPKETAYFTYEVVAGPLFWSQFFLPVRLFSKKDIDVFFSPAHYAPRFCPVPLVVTIHDLSYFYYPEEFLKKDLYKLKNWTARSIVQAKQLIAVSKNTKKDILKHYQIPENKVTVIYNGFEKKIVKEDDSVLHEYNISKEKYILYVGTLQPRKNIRVLLDSFDQLIKKGEDFKLVIAGKKGWLYDEIYQQAQNLDAKNRIIFTGYVPDEKLVSLYKNAFCYVLPSLYEGFGIPVLEAMSYSCPVIASYSSSLPEIGGDACEYFDPNDASNLTDRFMELIQGGQHRKDLIKKGKEQVKNFSWKTSASATLRVLQNTV